MNDFNDNYKNEFNGYVSFNENQSSLHVIVPLKLNVITK